MTDKMDGQDICLYRKTIFLWKNRSDCGLCKIMIFGKCGGGTVNSLNSGFAFCTSEPDALFELGSYLGNSQYLRILASFPFKRGFPIA